MRVDSLSIPILVRVAAGAGAFIIIGSLFLGCWQNDLTTGLLIYAGSLFGTISALPEGAALSRMSAASRVGSLCFIGFAVIQFAVGIAILIALLILYLQGKLYGLG